MVLYPATAAWQLVC